MKKLKMHSKDWTDENIAKFAELFPNCVTESRDEEGNVTHAIDFDLLRQELSDHLVDGPRERYRLDWPGKREALLAANAPVAKALRPCREESEDFNTTENLFIEGDNLDALKLLQETYLGKVKMIYIDPPYNTGNDFIYADNFAESVQQNDLLEGIRDEEGNKLIDEERWKQNNSSNARFHSDWLSMIYSRLKLARNLLSDDGIIIISIDENEIANTRKVCDEVFGEQNLLFQITLLCNPKGRSQDKFVANCHEYLVAFSKQQLNKGATNVPKDNEEIAKNYKLIDKRGRYRELELRNTHREFGKHNRKNLYYPFFVNTSGDVCLENAPGSVAIYPDWDDGFQGCWTWSKDKARKQIDELVARQVKGRWKIYRKNYAEDDRGEITRQVKSIWTEKQFHTEKGQAAFNDLFGAKEKIFQSPKSVDTIRRLLSMASNMNTVILDFFAGSATTAHAVMQLNAEDGGNRKFIMVQLPEPCDENSEAFKSGYKNIAEIGKERIRRAGRKIKEENATTAPDLDIGFRVLKVDSSNMADVYYTPDAVDQQSLFSATDNIKPDRTAEDLLFQVLLDWGVDLRLPVTAEKVGGLEVYFVDENAVAACFVSNGEVTDAFCRELAKREPLRVVFRDSGFKDDSAKINAEQIFKQLSPHTEVRTL